MLVCNLITVNDLFYFVPIFNLVFFNIVIYRQNRRVWVVIQGKGKLKRCPKVKKENEKKEVAHKLRRWFLLFCCYFLKSPWWQNTSGVLRAYIGLLKSPPIFPRPIPLAITSCCNLPQVLIQSGGTCHHSFFVFVFVGTQTFYGAFNFVCKSFLRL